MLVLATAATDPNTRALTGVTLTTYWVQSNVTPAIVQAYMVRFELNGQVRFSLPDFFNPSLSNAPYASGVPVMPGPAWMPAPSTFATSVLTGTSTASPTPPDA